MSTILMESYNPLSTSDNDLMSLFKLPEEAASSAGVAGPPVSFETPFDDPDMEPAPFRSHIPNIEPTPVSSLCPSKSSVKQESKEPDLGKSLVSLLLDPANDIVRSKRSHDDVLSATSGPSHSKSQRLSPQDSSEESVLRFRPYQDYQWRGMFQKLVQYKLKHGHCCVPHSYQEDPMLARWVKRQRYQHKKFEDNDPTSTMTVYRIEQLTSIGFVWHSHASAWQTKLNELKAFKNRTGHCNVPSNYRNNPSLSAWIRCQRRQYRLWKSGCNSTMTAQRYELLESLGFAFENQKLGPKKVQGI